MASQHIDEDILGGQGYSEFLLSCIKMLAEEELIKRSPRGKRVGVLLNFLASMDHKIVADISITLITMLNNCLEVGSRHVLPSVARAAVWSDFHQLRSCDALKQPWNMFITSQVPEAYQAEHPLALQLIVDRLLKQLLTNKAKALNQTCEAGLPRPFTTLECNAIRYMAGYVGISLLKKFKKSSKNPDLQQKRSLFVRVLKGMCATDQPGEPESVLDYSKVWSETIDRGGLYHINDEVSIHWCLYTTAFVYTDTSNITMCICTFIINSLLFHCPRFSC